jgi:hypothetical protein
MVAALGLLDRILPEACRRRVEECFGVTRMADDYLAAYRRILASSRVRFRSSLAKRHPHKYLAA